MSSFSVISAWCWLSFYSIIRWLVIRICCRYSPASRSETVKHNYSMLIIIISTTFYLVNKCNPFRVDFQDKSLDESRCHHLLYLLVLSFHVGNFIFQSIALLNLDAFPSSKFWNHKFGILNALLSLILPCFSSWYIVSILSIIALHHKVVQPFSCCFHYSLCTQPIQPFFRNETSYSLFKQQREEHPLRP